jgi:succinate-acetate transporter protein
MGVLCLVFLICAFRTNICFVFIFFTLLLAFIFLTAAYWLLGSNYEGNAAMATKMVKVSIRSSGRLEGVARVYTEIICTDREVS